MEWTGRVLSLRPTPPRLREVTAATVLRRALAAHRANGTRVPNVAHAMHVFCASARRRELPVSPLIIAIKGAWAQSADVQGLPPKEARLLLDRLVTMCITEFYAPTTE